MSRSIGKLIGLLLGLFILGSGCVLCVATLGLGAALFGPVFLIVLLLLIAAALGW